jgi:three-Cys-motif partner protein
MSFFDEQRAAAVLKHGILRRYLEVFARKTGVRSSGRRVVFLDGYAGPGAYESGAPGSPVLAAQTAATLDGIRDLQLVFVEKKADTYDQLVSQLEASGRTNWVAYRGTIEENMEHVLEEAADFPLLAFFDPFGLPIPFDMLRDRVLGRPNPQGVATEVYLNFSLAGLRRCGGKLRKPQTTNKAYAKSRERTLEKVDESLGGDWWREAWLSGAPNREDLIVAEYANRLGWAGWIVPAPNWWEGSTAYYLILLTKHPDGVWAFHESLSLAMEDLYTFCHQDQLSLYTHEERGLQWIEAIANNVERLMGAGKPLLIRDHLDEIYGDALILAREKHLRAAIKTLRAQGKTKTEGRGELAGQWLLPP